MLMLSWCGLMAVVAYACVWVAKVDVAERYTQRT